MKPGSLKNHFEMFRESDVVDYLAGTKSLLLTDSNVFVILYVSDHLFSIIL